MRIAYITSYTPYGYKEAFILEEMLAVLDLGVDLIVAPRNPQGEIFHGQARRLLDRTLRLPLINWQIITRFCLTLCTHIYLWRLIWRIVCESRNIKIMLKNLVVMPKSVYLAYVFKQLKVEHIHAHWGSTTSTMALIISEISSIPWSFTLHRWDIAENNLLRWKVERAAFARCTSKDGYQESIRLVGAEYQDKFRILPTGLQLPVVCTPRTCLVARPFTLATPANLVPKKGHRYLIEALRLLLDEGLHEFQWLIIGKGPLEPEIRRQVREAQLEPFVKFLGWLPHESLFEMYEKGEIDAVVLPSIILEDNEREGMPNVLIEAMAYGIPVISTATGGIPELLSGGCGILVPEKDPERLAQAIRDLISNQDIACEIAQRGRRKIEKEYNLKQIIETLLKWMMEKLPRDKK